VRKQLDAFEKMVRRVVEGSFERVLRRKMGVQDLVAALYEEWVGAARQGRVLTKLVVQLHPADYERLCGEMPAFSTHLETEVIRLVKNAGGKMPASLTITLIQTDQIPPHTIQIEGEKQLENMDVTQTLAAIRPQIDAEVDIATLDAFLIVNGKNHVALEKPTINIGRVAKNDIVLTSAKVSRNHAQIRWRYGKFVLYDLGSRAGTYVNANLVRETVLAAGDVITLADATIIYGEGLINSEEKTTNKPVHGSETLSMRTIPQAEE
jgi:hypothetical protein